MTGFLLGIFPILAVLGLYTRRASEEAPVPGVTRWMAIPLFMTGSGLVLTLSLLDRFRDMLLAVGVLAFLTVLRVLSNRNLPARPPVH
jgi:hypothetical protein